MKGEARSVLPDLASFQAAHVGWSHEPVQAGI